MKYRHIKFFRADTGVFLAEEIFFQPVYDDDQDIDTQVSKYCADLAEMVGAEINFTYEN